MSKTQSDSVDEHVPSPTNDDIVIARPARFMAEITRDPDDRFAPALRLRSLDSSGRFSLSTYNAAIDALATLHVDRPPAQTNRVAAQLSHCAALPNTSRRRNSDIHTRPSERGAVRQGDLP